MELKNNDLVMVARFIDGLTLPAQVSRARTKLFKKIKSAVDELMSDEIELAESHHGVIDGKMINWESHEDEVAYENDHKEMMEEVVEIQFENVTLLQKLIDYLNDFDGDVSGEDAEAFDVLCEALGI